MALMKLYAFAARGSSRRTPVALSSYLQLIHDDVEA